MHSHQPHYRRQSPPARCTHSSWSWHEVHPHAPCHSQSPSSRPMTWRCKQLLHSLQHRSSQSHSLHPPQWWTCRSWWPTISRRPVCCTGWWPSITWTTFISSFNLTNILALAIPFLIVLLQLVAISFLVTILVAIVTVALKGTGVAMSLNVSISFTLSIATLLITFVSFPFSIATIPLSFTFSLALLVVLVLSFKLAFPFPSYHINLHGCRASTWNAIALHHSKLREDLLLRPILGHVLVAQRCTPYITVSAILLELQLNMLLKVLG